MTRNDIATQLAEKSGLAPSLAMKTVNCVIDIITDALKKGDKIYIRGFATIETVERKAHNGYNFSEGKTVLIPARRMLKIKEGKEFSEKLNERK